MQHADGKPWRYTGEQLRFVLHWFALDDDLRFVYRDGVLQRLKGWGKDPLAATICATEFVGPCRPDPAGRTVRDPWGNEHPAGVSHPEAWVQTVAVARDQTRNTMTLFPGLFTKRCLEEYQIDLGKEIIYALKGQKRIEAVTSSPRTLEGARATHVSAGETHHWIYSNEGHEMAAVIQRNAAKIKDAAARRLAHTNAYEPGGDSVAERDREAYEKSVAGTSLTTGILYDSLEAPPEAPLAPEAIPAVIEAVRGDSWWLDVERITQEILDSRNPPSQSRRFWYNQITATEDAWVTKQEWEAGFRDFDVPVGSEIALGFDGSKAEDDTALIGCHIETDHLFDLGILSPVKRVGDERAFIDRGEVDRAVRTAFELYDVVGFYADTREWESYIDRWAEEFGDQLVVKATQRQPVAWDTKGRVRAFTAAAERLHDAIVDSGREATKAAEENRESGQRLTHDGSKQFGMHVLNARMWPNQFGISIRKESPDSAKRIDAADAAVLSRLARSDYLALPANRRRKKGGGKIWGA